MKIIKYNFLSCRINHGTEEEPNYEEVILPKEIRCTADNLSANEEIAKKEAYNGEYTIDDDGVAVQILAPHNIVSGEYVTIDGVMYLATENIPNGEPIIVGQNAIVTTIEAQLHELKGE